MGKRLLTKRATGEVGFGHLRAAWATERHADIISFCSTTTCNTFACSIPYIRSSPPLAFQSESSPVVGRLPRLLFQHLNLRSAKCGSRALPLF